MASIWQTTHLLSDNSNFLRLGNLGKVLNDVRPTLIKLSFSNAVNSSVKPSIDVLRQLSRLSSLICKREGTRENLPLAIRSGGKFRRKSVDKCYYVS